ncbi:addiction module antidote protein [Mameliella alba]|uniref:addiction module antidote protein n=1 Tax=Mameliella alba TaxID=561184 RepID=UPI000B52DCD9|nr:addiction module antidote protein [Mameliella alba]OWV41237.1 putative addiction module antidote protein [Mameliella alba]
MQQVTLDRYDSADYIKTDEDIAAYLEAGTDEGIDDHAFLLHTLGVIARVRGTDELVRITGMNQAQLSEAFSGHTDLTVDTMMKITKALGLKLAITLAS